MSHAFNSVPSFACGQHTHTNERMQQILLYIRIYCYCSQDIDCHLKTTLPRSSQIGCRALPVQRVDRGKKSAIGVTVIVLYKCCKLLQYKMHHGSMV